MRNQPCLQARFELMQSRRGLLAKSESPTARPSPALRAADGDSGRRLARTDVRFICCTSQSHVVFIRAPAILEMHGMMLATRTLHTSIGRALEVIPACR